MSEITTGNILRGTTGRNIIGLYFSAPVVFTPPQWLVFGLNDMKMKLIRQIRAQIWYNTGDVCKS